MIAVFEKSELVVYVGETPYIYRLDQGVFANKLHVHSTHTNTVLYKWIWPRVVPDPGWLRETPLFTFLAASLASCSSPDRPERPGPAQGPLRANAPPSAAAHAVYAARAGRIWPKPGPF